jgi:methyl-accepting chemotaxis protein
VSAKEKLPPNSLPTPHHCRFGRWYDNVSDREAMDLAPFRTIRAPHEAVHKLGHQALVAVGVGDLAEARSCVQEMQVQAGLVLQCLDEFARDYTTTIHAKQAA